MRFRTVFFIMATTVVFSAGVVLAQATHEYPVRPVPFTAVNVADEFWTPRLVTSRETTIPYCFTKCEETGRIDNFARAGGLLDGKFEGIYFNDSDLYKIIEGAAYVLTLQKNEKLDKYLDDVIAKIAAAQEEDGYLYTSRTILLAAGKNEKKYNPPGGRPRWSAIRGHELYCVGHLYEAAVVHHVATGKRNLLDVAIKSADLICDTFGPNKKENWPPGHQEIEIGLARLYRLTGQKKYLDTAKFFLDARGRAEGRKFGLMGKYSQDHRPVVEQEKAVGHAVRAAYMYSGMADVAALVGDPAYVTAIDRIWHDVVQTKLYITGGIGAAAKGEGFGEPYNLPNRVAYCETCASIANVYWNHRLFCFTGDGKYIDVMERTLYNALLSGVSFEGNTFFYPNPLETEKKRARSPWFGCACCPSNIARFIPSVPGYVYAVDAAGPRRQLYVNLYVASDSTVKVGGDAIRIRQQTKYPWDGKVSITFETKADVALKLRIPGWARGEVTPGGLYKFLKDDDQAPTLSVNGQTVPLEVAKGYATIDRKWLKGDRVELELPMPVRRVTANAKIVENVGKVAIQRGPIVYCIEGVDVDAKSIPSLLLEDDQQLTSRFEGDLLDGVVVVQGSAQKTRWEKGPDGEKRLGKRPVAFRAIPYYAWAHRDADGMCVWIGRAQEGVRPEPLPKVLIIGDSISMAYMKPLEKLLAGKAAVVHNPGNAAHSAHGLANLEEWLGKTKWAVIHFNHGLHDLKIVDKKGRPVTSREEGDLQIPLDKYKENVEAIVLRLKKTDAKLIFATTTPYPDKGLRPLREPGMAAKYNAVALKIMKKHDVSVNDLHAFALPKLDKLQRPDNVHFKPEGSKALAKEVARHVLEAIGQEK